MQKATVTADEFVETLKRSSLPTVVTEGNDDYKFYRRIEENLATIGASLFPVGGRATVLEIFKRRRELGRNNVIFLADKDLWVFDCIPNEYVHRKIVFTRGYSIENDLYCDGDIESFLTGGELASFRSELSTLLEWYSFAVNRLLSQEQSSIAVHPNRIIGDDGALNASFMGEIGYTGRHEELFQLASTDYRHLLRGKNLIELILRQLSNPRRAAKFGRAQIMEIGSARRGAYLQRISDDIGRVLAEV